MKFSFLLLFAIPSTAFARGPAGTFRDFYGPEFHRQPAVSSNKNPNVASDVLHRWNRIAIDATGLDHTPVAPGENRVFGEQLGPGRSSRAMAIVHIADVRRARRRRGRLHKLHRDTFHAWSSIRRRGDQPGRPRYAGYVVSIA